MKTIYRVLVLGIFMAAVSAASATSIFAQDACADVDAKQALYAKFTTNYAGKIDQKKMAVEAGQQYIDKYGACPDDAQIVSYLKTNVPKIQDKIKAEEGVIARNNLYTSFDTALKAKNTVDTFTTGKNILATDPNLVDVLLVLASLGYDQAVANPPVDTYNNETINYAKTAIQKLEANTSSKTGDYGVLQYSYKTKDFPDGRANALGWMNYTIGYIDYYRLNKKEEALPYLYKASQVTSGTKNNPFLYQTIGSYYREKVADLGKQIVDKIEALRKMNADNKGDTDEAKALDAETKNLIALQKGYADRAIDAYARAYKMADPKDSNYKNGLYTTLKEIYNLRYEGKRTDVDAYVANIANTPMPDPTTQVTPVVEADTTTTTTGSASATPSATTPAAAKSATVTADKTPAKPASSTPANGATKVTVTKTNTPAPAKSTTSVKKPAPKK